MSPGESEKVFTGVQKARRRRYTRKRLLPVRHLLLNEEHAEKDPARLEQRTSVNAHPGRLVHRASPH